MLRLFIFLWRLFRIPFLCFPYLIPLRVLHIGSRESIYAVILPFLLLPLYDTCVSLTYFCSAYEVDK